MAIILRLDRMMADRKISLNELSEKVGIANVNLSKIRECETFSVNNVLEGLLW